MSRILSIVLSPEAGADLRYHSDYIAQANPDAAMRFFEAARATFADLARMPAIGRLYPSAGSEFPDLRQWKVKGFKAYLIFYRIQPESIQVVRIVHASQDLVSALKAE